VKIDAERMAGGLLKAMAERKERETPGGNRKSKSHDATMIPDLPDLGVKPDQSSRWQRMASVPDKALAERGERAKRGRPSKSDIVSGLRDLGVEQQQSSRWQRMALGLDLEAIEKPKAKEREKAGKGAGGSGGRGRKKPSGKLPEGFTDTRDAVGAGVGMSGKSYERAKAVTAGR